MITLHFESVEQAEDYATELESEIQAIKWALNANAFDDTYTANVMRREMASKEDDLEQLYALINQIRFPLL
ncbi:MAG: hypothetical protein ACO3TI_07345 [Aquiluna sp.]|jgi:uncharacterized protein YpiB (UPF0302 family)